MGTDSMAPAIEKASGCNPLASDVKPPVYWPNGFGTNNSLHRFNCSLSRENADKT